MNVQRIVVHGILEFDTSLYPPDDEDSQNWLFNDILLDTRSVLTLHSDQIGDGLGRLRITTAKEAP